jgi:hypothetical protein
MQSQSFLPLQTPPVQQLFPGTMQSGFYGNQFTGQIPYQMPLPQQSTQVHTERKKKRQKIQ